MVQRCIRQILVTGEGGEIHRLVTETELLRPFGCASILFHIFQFELLG